MFSIYQLLNPRNLTAFIKPPLPLRIYGSHRLESSASDSRAAVKYAQQKIGKRGGQNLTNRDGRLTKSIRQKQAFSIVGVSETNALDPSSSSNETLDRREEAAASVSSKPPANTFKGMIIPKKPRPPESDGTLHRRPSVE
jgi:hypothetical protein